MSINYEALTRAELLDLYNDAAVRLGKNPLKGFKDHPTAVARTRGLLEDGQEQATIDDPGMSSALLDEDEVEEKVSSDRNSWRGKSMAERAAHRGWANVEFFEKYREHKRASRKMKREGIAGWEAEHQEALRLKRMDRAAQK